MKRNHIISLIFMFVVVAATFYVITQENDMRAIVTALKSINVGWLLLSAVTALIYVALEGVVIDYLLRSVSVEVPLFQGIKWSYIGFFVSAITPSSTGGQPAQLYYMNKDGVKISESTPVLMITAVLFKVVAVVVGIALLFWYGGLKQHFGNYLWLYFLGLGLNVMLVVILVVVMMKPSWAQKCVLGIEKFLVRIHVLKPSSDRIKRLIAAIAEYADVISFFRNNKFKILIATAITFVQRSCMFVMPLFVYLGMGLTGTSFLTIIALQAAVYITVDMLPLPGSVGINELIYSLVFSTIFSGEYLAASLLVTRGVSFYFLLFASLGVLLYAHFKKTTIAGQSAE